MAATEDAQAPSVDKRWVCDADIAYYDDSEEEQLHLGASCAGWGSIQGLPVPDLVFGSLITKVREPTECDYPMEDLKNGKVFIFPGPQPCVGSVPCEETRDPYRLTYSTANLNDPWISNNLGWAITYLGDLDGDGNDELAFSAPLHDVGPDPEDQDFGTVYVLFMADPHVFGTQYATGNNEFDLEPPTTAPINQSGFNVVRIRGLSANEWFGHSIAGPGDVTFDDPGDPPVPDLVVGAPHRADLTMDPAELETGKVYVIDGAALASEAAAMKAGAGALGGVVVDFTWDLSNDGNAKVLTPMHAAGAHPAARFGWSVTGMGDLDGDSRVDLAIGAPEAYFDCDAFGASTPGAWIPEPAPGGTGYVEVTGFNSTEAPELRIAIKGERDFDQFGWSVSGLGASPGQSGGNATVGAKPDLLVGAIGHDVLLGENERVDDVGKAYLFSGEAMDGLPDGTVIYLPEDVPHAIEAFSLEGTVEGELLGESVAGGGLTNETPFALFAIGSRLYDDGTLPGCLSPLEACCEWSVVGAGGDVGRAQTFAFFDPQPPPSFYAQIGDYTGERFRSRLGYGTALAWLPDMTGSGDSELLVGAPAWQPEVGRASGCNELADCQRPGRAYVLFQFSSPVLLPSDCGSE